MSTKPEQKNELIQQAKASVVKGLQEVIIGTLKGLLPSAAGICEIQKQNQAYTRSRAKLAKNNKLQVVRESAYYDQQLLVSNVTLPKGPKVEKKKETKKGKSFAEEGPTSASG